MQNMVFQMGCVSILIGGFVIALWVFYGIFEFAYGHFEGFQALIDRLIEDKNYQK